MSKSIRLVTDAETYLDSSGVSHNREELDIILDEINSSSIVIPSNGVDATTVAESTLLSRSNIPDGRYLIYGSVPMNYQGQTGRELRLRLKKNNSEIWGISNVCNTYMWTMYTQIVVVADIKSSDTLSLTIGDPAGKTYSCAPFAITLFRLK